MSDWPLSSVRFLKRERVEYGSTSVTIAMYTCPKGFLVIWTCSCGMVHQQVVSNTDVEKVMAFATEAYLKHYSMIEHP